MVMGRIRTGFHKGEIVIALKSIDGILTEGKEYVVLEYWGKDYQTRSSLYKEGEWPKITINEDRQGLKKLLPCHLFMSKSKWLAKKRIDTLNKIL